MNEVGETLFCYYIIEFSDCKNINNQLYVDLVPNTWINFNHDKTSGSVKYADPPYKINNAHTVASMVQFDFRPLPFWKLYPVKIRNASRKHNLHHIN